ncbi:hypothetical protein BO78DRAFT_401001 [Aspergillus sclerotiicarbonarius CBS 121057]|uniref:Uncharacterized protein n=1 Tax=Aspergillus sclerotiicarbonarius (strain CBS 121057 / IBT 28362) TaxID=1448318 RepID=A0A319EM29_ASPSB|nr:hypothetical protein BO78DRAFT_401001 [Aspergillus sclerotiicarbonarius CBS 121057]
MVRHEYGQGRWAVAVGHDQATGYFIGVYDRRLDIEDSTGDDFECLAYSIAPDGTGCYLNAYTGRFGMGQKVGLRTMERLWRMYY